MEKRTFGTTPFETLPYYYPENPIPNQKKKIRKQKKAESASF